MVPILDSISIEEATVCLIDYRGKTPPKTNSGVRLVTAKVVKGGQILDEPAEFIAEEYYDEWMQRGIPQINDVLITTEAPLGEVAILKKDARIALAQRIILLRANPMHVNPMYLFYALQSEHGQNELKARSSGTTVLGIKQSELRKVRLPLLPLKTQQSIVDILLSYDELIENNQRRIKILEEMARSLYREWFVNFRYPGHEKDRSVKSALEKIPEGWERKSFEDILISMTGGDWGAEGNNESENSQVKIVRGTDFDELKYGGELRTPTRYIKFSSLRSRKLQDGDVIVENSVNAKSRCVGTPLLVDTYVLNRLENDAVAASFCKVFRLIEPKFAPIVYLHLMYLREVNKMEYYQNTAANGIGNFQAQKFSKEEHIFLPIDKTIQSDLIERISLILREISVLASQINNLRQSRDILLPRLMSGQMTLKEN